MWITSGGVLTLGIGLIDNVIICYINCSNNIISIVKVARNKKIMHNSDTNMKLLMMFEYSSIIQNRSIHIIV